MAETKWKVYVEQTYVKADGLPEPREGEHVWIKDSRGTEELVKVNKILPPESPDEAGTIFAEFINQ